MWLQNAKVSGAAKSGRLHLLRSLRLTFLLSSSMSRHPTSPVTTGTVLLTDGQLGWAA